MQCPATSPAGLLISRFQVRVLGGSLGKILDLQVKRDGARKPPMEYRGLWQQCGSNRRLPQNLIHRIAYPAVHAWQDVRVGVKSLCYGGMPKKFLDVLGVDVTAE